MLEDDNNDLRGSENIDEHAKVTAVVNEAIHAAVKSGNDSEQAAFETARAVVVNSQYGVDVRGEEPEEGYKTMFEAERIARNAINNETSSSDGETDANEVDGQERNPGKSMKEILIEGQEYLSEGVDTMAKQLLRGVELTGLTGVTLARGEHDGPSDVPTTEDCLHKKTEQAQNFQPDYYSKDKGGK